MTSTYLSLVNGEKKIEGSTIFTGVTFSAHPTEMLALTGPSGSGKTTLLNCLGCLSPFDTGTYRVDQLLLSSAPARTQRRLRKEHLGYLFQNYALVEEDTVEANLRSPFKIFKGSQRPTAQDREQALTAVGLAHKRYHRVYQLSGGEQQRVALATLLLKKPRLILADEPTGALDSSNAQMVVDSLRSLADRGVTVIIATHSQYIIDRCDRTIDIEDFKKPKPAHTIEQ